MSLLCDSTSSGEALSRSSACSRLRSSSRARMVDVDLREEPRRGAEAASPSWLAFAASVWRRRARNRSKRSWNAWCEADEGDDVAA